MNKRFHSVKLMPVWLAISSAVIIAGIILYCLFGFNMQTEFPTAKRFEVTYDTVITIGENTEEELQKLCEDIFAQNGLTVKQKQKYEVTGGGVLEYTFEATASDEALAKAEEAVAAALNAQEGIYADADTFVTVHKTENRAFAEANWRGAIAVAVGCVVALVYLGVRFGVVNGVTGLIACLHDALFTLSLFAICRIPVYAYAPLLFGAIAAAVSLILWTVQSMKMRENFKDPSYAGMTVAEAVEESSASALKIILGIVCALAVSFALFGALATAGVRLFFLPALIPVAVGAYSSLALAPAVHGHMKKSVAATAKKKRYEGAKKKAEEL
jgi:SecD/SecF fusion protein